MKKLFYLILTGLFLVTLVTNAQPQRLSAEERAKRTTDMMKEKLALTDVQLTKVDSINLKYAKDLDEVMKKEREAGNGFDGIRQKREESETKKREEFKSILTADQLTKYDEMLAEQRRNRPGGGGGGPR
jgi:periplasmic protein CpxP/Spy